MTVAAMERVTDWVNDRLPAVLVKEVRQGLSRSVFLIEFYGFHVVLACITLWQMAEAQQYEDFGGLARSSGTRGVFWFLMALYMIIIVPLMNINAVASEVTGRTIELMKMSGLSARKIVWGKWLYQCLYLAMITLSTFPYLFSYYLVAGGDLMMEVRLMLGLGFGSILVTGLAIGISPIGSSRFRPMIFLGLMIFFFAGGVQLFSYFFGFRRGVSFGDSALTLFLLGTPLTLFALELGTAKISSRVEGNALAIRLIGLVLVGVPGLMILGNLNAEFATGFASGAIVIIPWSVMLTQPVLAAGAYGQYLKYGYFGRFMGRLFFYPGWVSGVMYCTVLIGLYDIMILLLNHSVSDGDKLEMM
ncbi:MAG: ABC transporter permease subunit, partial [Verrucomicrobiota bacterium]